MRNHPETKLSRRRTIMKLTRIGLIAIGLLLLSSTVFAQKVTTDSAPNVNWSSFHSYAWGQGTAAPNPLTDQRIIAGIDAQLAAKGWTKVTENPDVIVIYHASSDQQKSLNWSSFGGWGRFGGMGSAQVDTVTTGQLIVDMANAKEKQFIWRGTAADTVSSDPKKLNDKLNKSISKMFEKFPPK
jgi:uncharacterized protein DUF4136